MENIINSIEDLGKEQKDISINVLHAETGNVTESDVMLAAASDAIILGFAVEADASSRKLAETEGVSIRLYQIIYRLLEDIEKALSGLLEPELVEKTIGKAQVLATFKVSKGGMAAGCRVIDGELRRNAKVRVIRDNAEVFSGEFLALKREKDDVREVLEGFECGISLAGFDQLMEGDIIESYIVERIARKI